MKCDRLKTARIILRPIDEKDYPLLNRWRNEQRFMMLCSARRHFVTSDQYAAELKRDFERDRHLQFIIELTKGEEKIPIGTIYSYLLNLIDGHVFITAYIDEDHELMGYGAEAVAILLCYLFESFPIHKVYFEAISYNDLSVSTMKSADFAEEGRFKEHRFFADKRYDLIRFAVYRKSYKKYSRLLARFRARKRGQ